MATPTTIYPEDICFFGSSEIQHKQIEKGLLYDYINMLVGNKVSLAKTYLDDSTGFSSLICLEVYKAAIELFLGWTPEEAAEKMDEETMKLMHLDVLTPYLALPPEIKKGKQIFDYKYIIHLIYPDKVPYNYAPLILSTYQKVAKSSYGHSVKYPANYFQGCIGRRRAIVCMQWFYKHAIEDEISCETEAYRALISAKGIKMLRKYKLKLALETQFDSSPVQALHSALPQNENSEFLWHYYEFAYRYKEAHAQYEELQKLQKAV